jgi:hypothetical protein
LTPAGLFWMFDSRSRGQPSFKSQTFIGKQRQKSNIYWQAEARAQMRSIRVSLTRMKFSFMCNI